MYNYGCQSTNAVRYPNSERASPQLRINKFLSMYIAAHQTEEKKIFATHGTWRVTFLRLLLRGSL